jgi:hypothetical protein
MMRRFESVIARGAARGHPKMHDGSPPLELVMASTMKQVRNPDGCSRARRFDSCEQRMIVDDRIRQEDFVDAAPAKIQRGRVIEGAPRAHGCKPQIICAIPKTVGGLRGTCLRSGG